MDEDVPLEAKTFEWMQVAQSMVIPNTMLQDAELSIGPDPFGRQMLARLTAFVLTEQLPPRIYNLTVDLPTTWVDRLKRRVQSWPVVGRWPRRWPPRSLHAEYAVELHPFYVYPNASIPREPGGMPVRMHRIEQHHP